MATPAATSRVRLAASELETPLASERNLCGPVRGYRVRRSVRALRAAREGRRAWAIETVRDLARLVGLDSKDLETARRSLLDLDDDREDRAVRALTRAVELTGGDGHWPDEVFDDFAAWAECLQGLGAAPALVQYLAPSRCDAPGCHEPGAWLEAVEEWRCPGHAPALAEHAEALEA